MERIIGESALYVPGVLGKFDHLFSWDVLNHLLEFGGLSFPRLRLIKGMQEVPEMQYFRVGRSGYQRPLVREVTAELREGATLAIQSIEELHEPVAELCQTLESKLRIPVQADLFANCHDKPAGPFRRNEHDVIIIQIEGARDWQVHYPAMNFVTSGNEPAKPSGAPAWHALLNAHDLLYIPRGWWYRDEAVGDDAIYLGLKFRNPTGVDIISRLFERLAKDASMNIDVPPSREPERQSKFLEYIQEEFTEVSREPGLLLSFLAEMRLFAEPRIRFCLPWSGRKTPAVPSTDCIVLSLLRFPEAESVTHSEIENTCQIIVDGRVVSFSEDLASVLQFIFGQKSATVGSLLEACALDVPSERILDCLAELVRCGAVCLQESRPAPRRKQPDQNRRH